MIKHLINKYTQLGIKGRTEGEFLKFNPFLKNISKIITLKNYLHGIALLVAPAPLARPNNVVAPHALARQDTEHSTAFPTWKSLSRHSRWRDSTVLSRHRDWRDKTEILKKS